MPIDPGDLEALAEELAKDPREVFIRSAASRLYYSIFHYCEIFAEKNLSSLPYDHKSTGSHAKLVERFTFYRCKDDKNKQASIISSGHMLNQAKDIRVDADYVIDDEFSIDRFKEMQGIIAGLKEKLNTHFNC